nr:hypothetical protein [Tanacetum cinerariifolium]
MSRYNPSKDKEFIIGRRSQVRDLDSGEKFKTSTLGEIVSLEKSNKECHRGYKYHPLHVISYPLDQIRADLSYVEEPEAILDYQDRVMRNKTIPFVKILWRNHLEREATWETEESIRTSYPHFLP